MRALCGPLPIVYCREASKAIDGERKTSAAPLGFPQGKKMPASGRVPEAGRRQTLEEGAERV